MVQIVGNVSLRELAPNPMVGILGVTLDATASEAIATSLEWPADLLIMDESSGRAMARNLNIRKQYPHLSHPQPAIVPAPRPFATFACPGVSQRRRIQNHQAKTCPGKTENDDVNPPLSTSILAFPPLP